MTIKQPWSILRGRRTNFHFLNMSWTYSPEDNTMTDLISRTALLATLRKERDDYLAEHFAQDSETGTWEANNAQEEHLCDLEERIDAIEQFPGVKPIATLVNNNQAGWINLIETAPNVTIHVGTKLYCAPEGC